MTDDPSRLSAIRARLEQATEGPWFAETNYSPEPYCTPSWYVVNAPHHPSVQLSRYVAEAEDSQDAEFIAHAREDIPYLLAEIDTLSSRLQAREAELRGWEEMAQRVMGKQGRDTMKGTD